MSQSPQYLPQFNIDDTVTVMGKTKIKTDAGGMIEVNLGVVECLIVDVKWDDQTGWDYIGKVEDKAVIAKIRDAGASGHKPEDFSRFGEAFVERARKRMEEFDPTIIYVNETAPVFQKTARNGM